MTRKHRYAQSLPIYAEIIGTLYRTSKSGYVIAAGDTGSEKCLGMVLNFGAPIMQEDGKLYAYGYSVYQNEHGDRYAIIEQKVGISPFTRKPFNPYRW